MSKIIGRCEFLSNWPGWEDSIHSLDGQIDRQGRAVTYPFTFEIDESKRTARFSSTSDLPYYETDMNECTCYDFQERKLPCKHMYRLAAELGVINIIKRKSFDKEAVEKIKKSGDIDSEPDQLKRKKNAEKCKPIKIDYDNCIGVFSGSGKVPYETTINTCTCRDYIVRRLPCKHIYRLRTELEKNGN